MLKLPGLYKAQAKQDFWLGESQDVMLTWDLFLNINGS